MTPTLPFSEVLEAIDQLSLDEQETIMGILQHRVAEQGRENIANEVESARDEWHQGKCKATTVDELMDELLS